MQPLLYIVIWNLVALFLKCLDDQLTIDQVLECGLPRFLDLVHELVTGVLGTQQLFARRGHSADFRVCDRVSIHDRGNAIDNFRLRGKGSAAKRRQRQAKNCQRHDSKTTDDPLHSLLISS